MRQNKGKEGREDLKVFLKGPKIVSSSLALYMGSHIKLCWEEEEDAT